MAVSKKVRQVGFPKLANSRASLLQSFGWKELWILGLRSLRVPVIYFQLSRIQRIGKVVGRKIGIRESRSKTFRVAYGPTLPTWAPSLLFDKALSEALVIEGAELLPFFCDQSQLNECSVSLGKWSTKPFDLECHQCAKNSRELWKGKSPIGITKLSEDSPEKLSQKSLGQMSTEALEEFTYRDIELGLLARNLISNGNLSENPSLAPEYKAKLVNHIRNLTHIVDETENFIEAHSPHRWVLNDTTYGMWSAVSQVAQKKGIEVYNVYPLTKSKTVIARNSPAIDMDFQQEFLGFKKRPLSEAEEIQVERWLAGDRDAVLKSSSTILETADRGHAGTEKPRLGVLTANICWDSASLGKQKVFKSMIEWVIQTANWYAARPNLRLIIRAHPAETNPMIPETVETVGKALLDHFGDLPTNVTVSVGSSQQPWLEFLETERPDFVLVNTSTAGLEAAIMGYPVIVTGAAPYRATGFVETPDTCQDYFSLLESLHRSPKRLSQSQSQEARSFLSYYQFRYQSDFNLFAGNPPVLNANIEAVLSNENSDLRLLARKIIAGGALYSSTSWARNPKVRDE